jgi:type VI secretion system protein ImpA
MNPLKTLFSALTGGAAQVAASASAPVPAEVLAPISAAMPCGESLEYDTEYAVLQARLEPKADVQYGKFQSKPEAPDWVEIERDARRLFLRSKDISILVWFTRARCRMAGATGLLEGLSALQAVLQAYPEQVHPQLVLDGVPDPAVRANALAALCDPEGLLGDLRDVVVSGSTAFRLTVRDIERAFAFPRPPYAPEPEGVKRQLADLHAKGDSALLALLACGQCVQAISHWSQQHLQDDAPTLTPMLSLLASLASFADVPQRTPKMQADALEQGAPQPLRAVQGLRDNADAGRYADQHLMLSDDSLGQRARSLDALHAPLQHHPSVAEEREQIRALLRQVRLWIEHHEPSSPVTILIKQADRMWGKRFSEVAGMIPPDLMAAWDRDD